VKQAAAYDTWLCVGKQPGIVIVTLRETAAGHCHCYITRETADSQCHYYILKCRRALATDCSACCIAFISSDLLAWSDTGTLDLHTWCHTRATHSTYTHSVTLDLHTRCHTRATHSTYTHSVTLDVHTWCHTRAKHGGMYPCWSL